MVSNAKTTHRLTSNTTYEQLFNGGFRRWRSRCRRHVWGKHAAGEQLVTNAVAVGGPGCVWPYAQTTLRVEHAALALLQDCTRGHDVKERMEYLTYARNTLVIYLSMKQLGKTDAENGADKRRQLQLAEWC
jgi:hypothetical protein